MAGLPFVASGTMSFEPVDEGIGRGILGAELGVTNTIATVFSSLNCGSRTDATSFVPWTSSKIRCGACPSPFTSITIGSAR